MEISNLVDEPNGRIVNLALIVLWTHVRSQYNAAQLIPATNKMISKLKKYLVLALEKPAPIFSMILDLRIKLKHLEKNQHFLAEQHITTFEVLTHGFCAASQILQHNYTTRFALFLAVGSKALEFICFV
ncbi:uncharacterized protein VP01_4209g1, partial [Puccinia sorghi]